MKSIYLTLLIVFSCILFVVGCGGSNESKTTSSSSSENKGSEAVTKANGKPVQTISVSEREFKITPTSGKVSKSGNIAIKIKNTGSLTHSLVVEAGKGDEVRAANVSPGKSTVLRLNLKPGRYDWYCPIDSHRQLGMSGTLTVAKDGSVNMKSNSKTHNH